MTFRCGHDEVGRFRVGPDNVVDRDPKRCPVCSRLSPVLADVELEKRGQRQRRDHRAYPWQRSAA